MHPMPLETWTSSCCLCVSGNQAHGVQKGGGRWEALYRASAGSRERCNRFTLVEIKGRAREHSARELSAVTI